LRPAMSSQDSSNNYLEQMGSLFGSVAGYMRLPFLVSSVLFSYSRFLGHGE